ncbi:menaquinone-dependent protoporphyrinogen oxidase [Geodermatophilus obscurus]|uniref:Menaquinone-dependent protoporphyrinogen oxidase n=1 Tax=Geodermatophilus obscurus TaxID=1861 RepID=A0A1M7U629_9ACTN|nr:flavodoxin domain-containing protein [Geodermatophilus obscurus]SHN78365.1 menaquinone-dependent protoporphyrinogen oxidase [Geodermatophilus obscurus]
MTRARPRVLVTAASRHGSTHGIAEALARRLRETAGDRGLTAAALHAENRPDPAAFDAVVLGSAVYHGSWLEPARDLAHRHAAVLRARPLWLFSSGPIGEPPYPPDEPYDAATLTRLLVPRGHQVFPGRLEPTLLTAPERAVVTAMRAPVGDFRDWDAVRSWAAEIATALTSAVLPTEGTT